MKLILFGAPGAGKGTLAGKIKKILPDIAHISTGDLFRYNLKNNTPIGLKAKGYMESGKLVPDEVVIEMVKDRLSKEDAKDHFMLDGFPRTIEQVKALEEITPIDYVLALEVPKEELINRILGRYSCPKCGKIYNIFNPELAPKNDKLCDVCNVELEHRSDDTKETLEQRIQTYEEQSMPCLKYYVSKGIVKMDDGTRTMSLTEDDIKEILEIQ